MPSADLLLAFLAATAVFAYMPGPAMLYAAAQTVARGRRAGFMACLGIHMGGYVHVIAAAFGLAALFAAVPVLFTALKIAGAIYLVWLGLTMIRRRGEAVELDGILPARSARRAFFDSILVEVLNPKAALFYLAFLPQFVDPAAAFPLWVQFLILGTVVNAMFASADLVAVWLSARMVQRLRRSDRVQRWMRLIGGTLLVGLGARLALERSGA